MRSCATALRLRGRWARRRGHESCCSRVVGLRRLRNVVLVLTLALTLALGMIVMDVRIGCRVLVVRGRRAEGTFAFVKPGVLVLVGVSVLMWVLSMRRRMGGWVRAPE